MSCNYYMDGSLGSDDYLMSDMYYDPMPDLDAQDSQDLVEEHPIVTIHEMQEPKQSFCLLDPNPGSCRGKVCTESVLTSKIIPTIHPPR